jgi:hypothetical protein
VAVGEVDVLLVEDGCPLEGCSWRRSVSEGATKTKVHTVLRLASCAMAQFAVQGLSPAQLILDLSAVAIGLVFDVEVLVFVMHLVGCALLPLGDACRRLAAALIFTHVWR